MTTVADNLEERLRKMKEKVRILEIEKGVLENENRMLRESKEDAKERAAKAEFRADGLAQDVENLKTQLGQEIARADRMAESVPLYRHYYNRTMELLKALGPADNDCPTQLKVAADELAAMFGANVPIVVALRARIRTLQNVISGRNANGSEAQPAR